MIEVDIPGRGQLELKHVVMDVNGTIAVDGKLSLGVIPRLHQLRRHIQIHLLTADTHGAQASIDAALNLKAHIITGGAPEKADYVQQLGANFVVAMGNGANDVDMCRLACISIAVIGGEGLASVLLQEVDILVDDVKVGLDLLLNPNRLRATLRTS